MLGLASTASAKARQALGDRRLLGFARGRGTAKVIGGIWPAPQRPSRPVPRAGCDSLRPAPWRVMSNSTRTSCAPRCRSLITKSGGDPRTGRALPPGLHLGVAAGRSASSSCTVVLEPSVQPGLDGPGDRLAHHRCLHRGLGQGDGRRPPRARRSAARRRRHPARRTGRRSASPRSSTFADRRAVRQRRVVRAGGPGLSRSPSRLVSQVDVGVLDVDLGQGPAQQPVEPRPRHRRSRRDRPGPGRPRRPAS